MEGKKKHGWVKALIRSVIKCRGRRDGLCDVGFELAGEEGH